MGWLSDTFGGVGDVLEDLHSWEAFAGSAAGAATGFMAGGPIGLGIGAVVGGLMGGVQSHENTRAEEAQQAQVAAAQKLADMQDPSRVVQQTTPAQTVTQQAQVNEINQATEKARKLTVAKMNYNSGLGGFSSFGSARTDKLG